MARSDPLTPEEIARAAGLIPVREHPETFPDHPLTAMGVGDDISRLTSIAATLRGPHPWIPGAAFRAHPGLGEYLARCIETWNPA